jgi:hypothetical protein
MIAYEVLIPLEISYPDKRQTSYSNMTNFHLDVGDFFFLESGYWGRVPVHDLFAKAEISSVFVETNVLKKIVFKSTKLKRDAAGEIDFYKVWEEEDNINLFNPLINKRLTIEEALEGFHEGKLIVESVAWKRADKLKELGI